MNPPGELKQEFRRKFIRSSFEERSLQNSQYSLRAFARDLGANPSTVHQFINGKRPVSDKAIIDICVKLGADWLAVARNEHLYCLKSSAPTQLSESLYDLRSKWYYFAILELLHTGGFVPDIKWIADRLSLQPNIVQIAVEKLFLLKAILVGPGGEWCDNLENVTFISSLDMDIQAGRQHQKQLLGLAEKSINTVSKDFKDHTSLSFAIDAELVSDLKLKIAQFRQEISNFINENERTTRSEVYCIQVNLFPLSNMRPHCNKENQND